MSDAKIPGGYILQPRIFDRSEAAKMPPVTRELWLYILRSVNHADYENIKRGQGFFRFADIQEALCWYVGYRKMMYSKPQITKSLRRLCEGNMTATMKATRGIIITVCNYDFYQDPKNYEGNDEETTKVSRRKSQGHTIYKKDKEEGKKKEIYTTSFLAFWDEYPNKKAKMTAFRAWNKNKITNGKFNDVMEGLSRAKKSKKWSRNNGQFIEHPSTWINGHCWEDEETEQTEELY